MKTRNSSRIYRAFDQWVSTQDEATVLAGVDAGVWFGVGAFVVVAIALAGYAPGVRDIFHLNAPAAALCFLPVLLSAALFQLGRPKSGRLTGRDWMLLLVCSFFMKFFLLSFVVFSQMPGAIIFAALVPCLCGVQGYLNRVTLGAPFVALNTAFAGICAAAIAPDATHLAIFAIIVPAGVTVEFILGTIAARTTKHHAEIERLQSAVDAEILDRQVAEVARLADSLVDVLSFNHDIANAVTSIELASDVLLLLADNPNRRGDLRKTAEDLKRHVKRVRVMLTTAKSVEPTIPEAEPVEIRAAIEGVIAQIRPRFRHVKFSIDQSLPEGLRASVRGGGLSVHRIFQNLLTNACEGDGTAGATTIQILSTLNQPAGSIRLSVQDDGPGFPPAFLSQPLAGFLTSKPHGTGLGLHTSDRLVRASGGTLERANREEGGARVSIALPLDPATPEALTG